MDLALRYRYTLRERGFTLEPYLFLCNFLDRRYAFVEGYPMPGLDVLAGNTHAAFCDVDAGPTKAWIAEHRAEPAVKPYYDRAFGKRPARELYDLRHDPYELKNVAEDPAYVDKVKQLDTRLFDELRATADPRASGGGDEFDRYEYRRK